MGISLPRLILVFLPFVACFIIGTYLLVSAETEKTKLKKIIKHSTVSVDEKRVTNMVKESESKKDTFASKQNAKMNLLGINYKFEFLISVAVGLFVIGAIASKLVFKAGPLLMIYLGCLLGYSVFAYINSLLIKRKEGLNVEFLEKMRDIAALLSVGKELVPAIKDASEMGNISNVMYRELEQVRKEIFTNTKASKAFMNMYDRLKIEDIKMYAETLSVYEKQGGNIITVMKQNDQFATSKLNIRNEQNVMVAKQRSQQKIIIGCPFGMIVFFFLFNPSFFGSFYSTVFGQILAIVCITALIFGVTLSNKWARGV